MKKLKRIILAGVVIALLACLGVPLLRSWSDRRLLSKPESEIVSEMKKTSAEKLIKLINRLEKKLPSMEQKVELLPLYTALMDKAKEFSDEQLVRLIEDEDTLAGIENVFVDMFAENGYDRAKLTALLDNPDIDANTRSHIVSKMNYTADELSDIFKKYDENTAVVAMQKLCNADSSMAMQLVRESLTSGLTDLSDGKLKAVCLGIANYYEQNRETGDADKIRADYAPILKQIFEKSGSELVKDQAIYALARICDPELFAWLIENSEIDKPLKVTAIERNITLMKKQIASAKSEDDLKVVIEAMRLHRVTDIGEALQQAIDAGQLPASDTLRALIADIQKNGIKLVDKYETP